jgi:hypothetical protein
MSRMNELSIANANEKEKTVSSTELTTTTNMPADDGWDDAAREAEERAIRGTLVTFADWKWTAGKDQELPDGTQLVTLTTSRAWVKWWGGKPVEHRPVEPGKRMPDQEDMPDRDKSLWELGPDNKPRDPWANTRYVYMVNPATAEAYTFSTHSGGGRSAVSDLGDQIKRMRSAHPDAVPVVELRSRTMQTAYGKKSAPVLKIVAWRNGGAAGAIIPPVRPRIEPPKTLHPAFDAEIPAFDDESPAFGDQSF